jgi:hypothetical protein
MMLVCSQVVFRSAAIRIDLHISCMVTQTHDTYSLNGHTWQPFPLSSPKVEEPNPMAHGPTR